MAQTHQKKRRTRGKADGIRFDWDAHGLPSYDVPVVDRTHEDSGDLIAAKIRKSWSDTEPPDEPDEP